MKLTKREQVLLVIMLVVIVITLFLLYVYFPMNKKIKNLQLQSNELSIQIQEATQSNEQTATLQKQIKKIQVNLKNNSKDIMKIWDQAEVLVLLEDTIKDLGIKNSIEIMTPVDACGLRCCDINVNLKIKYADLVKLIGKLSKLKYYNIVTSIEIVEPEGTENSELLDTNMVLRFFSSESTKRFKNNAPYMSGSYKKSNIFE